MVVFDRETRLARRQQQHDGGRFLDLHVLSIVAANAARKVEFNCCWPE
jgi:hypothetical protein